MCFHVPVLQKVRSPEQLCHFCGSILRPLQLWGRAKSWCGKCPIYIYLLCRRIYSFYSPQYEHVFVYCNFCLQSIIVYICLHYVLGNLDRHHVHFSLSCASFGVRKQLCRWDGNLWIEREFRLAALLLSSNFYRHGSSISWCYEVTTSIFDAEEARNLTHLERRISNMPEGIDTVWIHLTRRVLRNLRSPMTIHPHGSADVSFQIHLEAGPQQKKMKRSQWAAELSDIPLSLPLPWCRTSGEVF